MELRVNDYVRDHIYGIGKIIKCYDNELEIVFKKSRIKTSVSSYFEFNLNKSSPQIIDLIEENDYIRIITDTDFRRIYNSYGKLVIYRGKELPIETFSNDFISEIITHEQMEAMQYRVEE